MKQKLKFDARHALRVNQQIGGLLKSQLVILQEKNKNKKT